MNGEHAGVTVNCQVLIRPEHILISTQADPTQVAATIARVRYHGHDTLIDLVGDTPDQPAFVARIAGETTLRATQHVWLTTTSTPHIWAEA